ncbi:type VI secretion system baseplate subunit TssE [Massilia sp. PWRC2]|uniref:type VI secretion system baseplate subunit TssE n=1 Tax=Massilia sp. PWRC2 TaxID=2804626 RepID=UPI003CF976AA
MRSFSPGLFDRLADEDGPAAAPTTRQRARAQARDACRHSIMRDLVALLNTRCAMQADTLQSYPAVAGSVVNYGLIDFAGLCMTSDSDQQKICSAVRQAIERHEPRLHKVSVDLRPQKGSINRIEFVITAELKGSLHDAALTFDAVFRPSLQQYSIEELR